MIIDPYTWFPVSILAIETIATNTVALRVTKPDDYTYTPGQYSLMKVPVDDTIELIRQYSYASDPASPYLEFLIRKQPGGNVSSWLTEQAKVGTILQLTKPYGRFERVPDAVHHIMIAGGVGIAPFLSMVRSYPDNTTLIYSERSQQYACYDSELSKLLGEQLYLHLSSEAGRLHTVSLQPTIVPDAEYYLCGSKQFVDAIEAMLHTQRIDSAHIHREAFTL